MNTRLFATGTTVSLVLALAVFVAPIQTLAAMSHVMGTTTADPMPAAASIVTLTGAYSGQVKLASTVRGVYTDTLTLPTPSANPAPDLGSIDLALQLTQPGSSLDGYVDLGKTLIFSAEHTLTGTAPIAIGPYVHGSFNGVKFMLESEPLSAIVAGRTVKRQFRLTGAPVVGDLYTLTGEYRETLWGYARQPITVLGTFTLRRPAPASTIAPQPSSGRKLYLPVLGR